MKRITNGVLLLTLTTALTGCASVFDGVVSCETGIRNHVLSQKAWGHWSWCYDNLDHPMHFAKGFKAGYRNILEGGSGCQPTLPPQIYWKPCYQTPEGRCKINAWFDGFSHGALAAQQDGYSNMGEIPLSPTARMNLELANTPRDPAMFWAEPNAAAGNVMLPGDGGVVQPPAINGEQIGVPQVIDGMGTETPVQIPPVRPYD